MEYAFSIDDLLREDAFDHPVTAMRLEETHISWVILTGHFAYKLKKPVDLGFVDFTSLDKRRFYCEEELRLNRRLAPDYYLAVVPVYGPFAAPRIGGDIDAPVVDFAVKMKEFPQDALADDMALQGKLTADHVDAIAARVAAFHARIPRAPQDSPFGAPEALQARAGENFDQLLSLFNAPEDTRRIRALRDWSRAELDACADQLRQRRRDGYVRECHGDLHLGNIALPQDEVLIFDAIEFNEEFRWIDVMGEVSFLFMDLEHRGYPGLAWRFINAYLAGTGDYTGLRALRYFVVYRALVRAKVEQMRALEAHLSADERAAAGEDVRDYLQRAEAERAGAPSRLVIMHGLAGAGKSRISGALLEAEGMVRLCSDVERKRLHGLDSAARSDSAPYGGIYTPQATRSTFRRLRDLAAAVLKAGLPVVVDAAFLQRWQRDLFRDLAQTHGVQFTIVDVRTDVSVLQARVNKRVTETGGVSEAGPEILRHQLQDYAPLAEDELTDTLIVDGSKHFDAGSLSAFRTT